MKPRDHTPADPNCDACAGMSYECECGGVVHILEDNSRLCSNLKCEATHKTKLSLVWSSDLEGIS